MNATLIKLSEITSPDELSGRDTPDLLRIAAFHEDEEILMDLASHSNVVVRIAVAKNRNITSAVAASLRDAGDERVNKALDANDALAGQTAQGVVDLVRKGVVGEEG